MAVEKAHAEEWLGDVYTEHAREQFEKHRLPNAFQLLITACRQSTDPLVVKAITRYEETKSFLELLTRGLP